MAQKNSGLSESLEDYLEVILDLEEENKVARVKDIADKMGILRGSVTGALKNLAERGLINYEPYSFITLTPKGTTIAREVTQRHIILKDFLSRVLQMDLEQADANACRMEHAMDKSAIDRLVQFIDYINNCPRTGEDWIALFREYRQKGPRSRQECRECIDRCREFLDREKPK